MYYEFRKSSRKNRTLLHGCIGMHGNVWLHHHQGSDWGGPTPWPCRLRGVRATAKATRQSPPTRTKVRYTAALGSAGALIAVSSAACLLSLPSEQPQRGGAMWGLARFLLLSFLAALSAGLCICFATQIASVYRALRALCCLCIKGDAGDAAHELGRPHRTATLAATPKGPDKATAKEQVIEDAHAKRLIRSRSGGRLFSSRPQR